MQKLFFMMMAAFASIFAMPITANAQSSTTVSVADPRGISAVSDSSVIAMPAIPGGNVGFESNPTFFQGASLCVTNTGDNWAVKRDGTMDTVNSARAAACAPIGPDGRATVSGNFRRGATPFIAREGRLIAWAGRDRLTGLQ